MARTITYSWTHTDHHYYNCAMLMFDPPPVIITGTKVTADSNQRIERYI